MKDKSRGVSLVEVVVAVGIIAFLAMVVFELFRQNEAVFRDQNLILEAQQSSRAVVSQIADEIRMAGQGIPLYSSTFDSGPDEATAVVLNGSDETHLLIRAGVSGIESRVTVSVALALGAIVTLDVANARVFHDRLGTSPAAGRFVYIWGPCANEGWGWVRAEVISISTAANQMTLVPRQAGSAGRSPGADAVLATNDDVIQFSAPSSITLEEILLFYFDSASVKRATAANSATLTSPAWGAAAELGQNFTQLTFRYYTAADVEIPPPVSVLADRLQIARIDVHVVAETAQALSSGTRQSFALGLRAIPRNLRNR